MLNEAYYIECRQHYLKGQVLVISIEIYSWCPSPFTWNGYIAFLDLNNDNLFPFEINWPWNNVLHCIKIKGMVLCKISGDEAIRKWNPIWPFWKFHILHCATLNETYLSSFAIVSILQITAAFISCNFDPVWSLLFPLQLYPMIQFLSFEGQIFSQMWNVMAKKITFWENYISNLIGPTISQQIALLPSSFSLVIFHVPHIRPLYDHPVISYKLGPIQQYNDAHFLIRNVQVIWVK
jgi:hypothetical protein